MVRWRVGAILDERNLTRYWLVQKSKLPATTVYRVAAENGQARRVDGKTLDGLCRALGVGPGQLLEYVPGPEKKKAWAQWRTC
jgi:putative transcriptional regulator